jgi:hypothetical protein
VVITPTPRARLMPAHHALVACIVILTALAGVNGAGQDTDTLPPVPTGYLLVTQRGCGIEAIQLPTLQRKIVRPATPENSHDRPFVHSMSGPDSAGRIAYIEDHSAVAQETDRRHLLKTIQLDGTQDTALFSRPGDALWSKSIGNGGIGEHLALSPVGGRVAFHTDLRYVHMPNAALHVGSIEIWNIDSKQSVKRDVNAMDSPLAWFPDGKRLAYVKLADPAGGAVRRNDTFARQFRDWEKIPSVFVWDIDAGTETFLHVGWAPMVSQDGRFVLISGYEGAGVHVRVDVATGESTAYHEGKNAGGSVIACPAQDIVLTSGVTHKRKRGLFNLFAMPERIVTIGLASLSTDDFRTLLSVEYANAVSFGQVSEKRER